MARVIAFDVNETLLDLGALDPLFERAFGRAELRAQWFGQMLQLAFAGGLTGRYVDFTGAQRAALAMLAESAGDAARPARRRGILDAMRRLPAHADAAPALDRLRGAGLDARRAHQLAAGRGARPAQPARASRTASTRSSPPTRCGR